MKSRFGYFWVSALTGSAIDAVLGLAARDLRATHDRILFSTFHTVSLEFAARCHSEKPKKHIRY